MTAADLIGQVRAAGGQITLDGIDLILTAPRPLPPDLLNQLKAHKPDIVRALVPWPPKRRGLGGYGATPGVVPVAPLRDCVMARQILVMPEGDPVPGDDATPPQSPGVSLDLRAPLSPEDLADIAAGDITLETLQQYEEAAVAREAEDLKEYFGERAAILEHDGLPRPDAQLEAARITAALARNRGCLWASLRAALSDYPALLSQVPPRVGIEARYNSLRCRSDRPRIEAVPDANVVYTERDQVRTLLANAGVENWSVFPVERAVATYR